MPAREGARWLWCRWKRCPEEWLWSSNQIRSRPLPYPRMLELCKGDPLLFPRWRWVLPRESGPDLLGLRGMAGPEPGASSGHPQPPPPPPFTLASPETSRPELSRSQPQQGVGPGSLKEGQGQSQVQAAENKREKGSYPARPPGAACGAQRQRTLLASLLWNLKLPG